MDPFHSATIQLDFQLPQRFGLQFRSNKISADGTDHERPVMVRMLCVLQCRTRCHCANLTLSGCAR